jgi:hypothetical protein
MPTPTRRTPADVLACAERPAASFALQLPAVHPKHYVERDSHGTEDDDPRKNGPQHGNRPIYQRCGKARPKCNRRSIPHDTRSRSRIVADVLEESAPVCRVRTDMCAFLEDGRRLPDRDSGALRIKASSQDDFDGIATATSRYVRTAPGPPPPPVSWPPRCPRLDEQPIQLPNSVTSSPAATAASGMTARTWFLSTATRGAGIASAQPTRHSIAAICGQRVRDRQPRATLAPETPGAAPNVTRWIRSPLTKQQLPCALVARTEGPLSGGIWKA